MSDFINQYWRIGQLVKSIQMNPLNNNIGQTLSAYFTANPSIPSGVVVTQSGTTNTVSWTAGVVRFADQTNANSTTVEQLTMANIASGSQAITCPVSGSQKYVVAVLTMTVGDIYTVINTAAISATALTLAEIAAQSNPLAYVPIATITNNNDGTYTVSTDANCAQRYAFQAATAAQAIARLLDNVVLTPKNINDLFPNLAQSGSNITMGLTSGNPIIQTVNGATRGTMPNAGTTNNNIATVGDVNAVGAGFLSLALSNSSNNGLMLTGNIPGGSIPGNILVTQFLNAFIGDVPSGGTTYTFTLMQSILTANFPKAIIPFIYDDTGTVWGGIDSVNDFGGNISQVTIFLRETSSVTQSVSLGLYVVGYKLP